MAESDQTTNTASRSKRPPRPNYTPVPNQVIDSLLGDLSHPELKVMLVILRRTHGWHRDRDVISLSELSDLSCVSKSTCCDSLKTLEEAGLVARIKSDSGYSTSYEPVFEDEPMVSAPADRGCPPQRTGGVRPSGQGVSAPADSHKEERKQTDENVHVEKKFLDDSEESSQIDYRSVIAFMNKRKGTHLSAKQRQYIEAYDLTGLTLEKAASLFDGHFTNKKHQRVKSWPEHEKSKPRFERQYERLETGPIPEETIPEFLERAGCDPSFRHFLGLYAVSGRELTLPEVKAAWAYWQRMNESQRERTKDHAERTFPLKDASFLKSPENYLKSQPWTAIQMPRALPRAKQDKPDPNAEARRLLREEAARNGGFIRL